MNSTCLVIILLVIIICVIMFDKVKETFLSGGTIQQLFGKDNQDLYLNGSGIKPLVDGNFLLQYNQPTLMQNRIPRNQVNMPENVELTPEANNYPFGTDFYDNGDTGSMFVNRNFGKINNDITTVIPNQYTGEYFEEPLVNIAKPLNIV